MLVPALLQAKQRVIIAQTRGESFVQALTKSQGKYEVDTVLRDGSIHTDTLQVDGKILSIV